MHVAFASERERMPGNSIHCGRWMNEEGDRSSTRRGAGLLRSLVKMVLCNYATLLQYDWHDVNEYPGL